MPIVVNLDVMMAKRKMSLNELSDKVGLTLSNLSILKTGIDDPRYDLQYHKNLLCCNSNFHNSEYLKFYEANISK